MLVGIRTEDAAIARFGTEQRAATGARVEDHSGIGRHFLGFSKAAARAGEGGEQINHADPPGLIRPNLVMNLLEHDPKIAQAPFADAAAVGINYSGVGVAACAPPGRRAIRSAQRCTPSQDDNNARGLPGCASSRQR
jgi:hypothetical protein